MVNENIIGENVYGYQVNAKLGSGGMGDVYRATDTALGRDVALKMLHPYLTKDPQFLERFKKEARVLAKLVHPNIAVIYNFLEQNGNYVMVMEYVDGDNLEDLLRPHGVLPVQLLVPIFIQALEGLHHAHKKDILHRDIKPANVMLTSEGNLKLMDFGIAKIANEQRMTQVNKIVGTIEYMAPELIEGKDASVASDIYAMGITLYEFVSGNPPFENETDYTLMQAILKNKPALPEKINPAVPAALSEIILKSIEKNPADRYADARSFQQALIKAFPGYREIDLSILQKPMGATRVVDMAPTQMANVMMETKLADAATAPVNNLISAGKKFVANNKVPVMIAGAGVLIFILFLFLIRKHPGPADDLTKKKFPDKNEIVTPLRDSIARSNIQTIDNSVPAPVSAGLDEPKPLDKPTEAEPTPVVIKEEKKPEKKKVKKEEVVVKKSPEVKTVKPTEEAKAVTKPAEKQDIYIDSKVEVEFSIQGDFNNSEKRTELPVRFIVTSPVIYKGVTIIKQGATATGNIRIGRVMTDVYINSVTGANGQQLKLKSDKLHRKRSDLNSERNYKAVLEKGISMSL